MAVAAYTAKNLSYRYHHLSLYSFSEVKALRYQHNTNGDSDMIKLSSEPKIKSMINVDVKCSFILLFKTKF